MPFDTIVTQIATIIVAAIGGYALVQSARSSSKAVNQLNDLKEENVKQNSVANEARTIYNHQRDKDHQQLVKVNNIILSRIAVLESQLHQHLEWAEEKNYHGLIESQAHLIKQQKLFANVIADAVRNNETLPIDKLLMILTEEV